MPYHIFFSNPNEFLQSLVIAILRIKKHAKTITENEKELLIASGMDVPLEPRYSDEEVISVPSRKTPLKHRRTSREK